MDLTNLTLYWNYFFGLLLLDLNFRAPRHLRLLSVEDVRNYLSHIIHILFFDFFLNFLLSVRLQTPNLLDLQDVGGRYNDIREESGI